MNEHLLKVTLGSSLFVICMMQLFCVGHIKTVIMLYLFNTDGKDFVMAGS